MSSAEKVMIGSFLKRIHRPIKLDKDKKYKLVTIRMHHKGVRLRCLKKGSEIKSQMNKVRKGDFILSGIDARNGAIGIIPPELDGAIVTNDFWFFDIDEKIIEKKLFLALTQTTWFDEICRKGSGGITQRIRLQKDKFFNQQIQLPPKANQKKLLKKISRVKADNQNLFTEIIRQQTLLKKLRQSILQDAISGKLTEQWRKENPDVEPASEILKRIKKEKERLIKEKKNKKQKPLPPITDDEAPFELPKGWVLCRIYELLALHDNSMRRGPFGSAITKDMFVPKGTNTYKIYEQKNAIQKNYTLGSYYISEQHFKKLQRFEVNPNNIIISCAGTIGETYILPDGIPKGIINQALLKINLNNDVIINDFFVCLFKALTQQKINSDAKGSAMKNIGSVNYIKESIIFPLPPYDEQIAIISILMKHNSTCDQLESQTTKSQQDSEMLMQTVLKEAFEG